MHFILRRTSLIRDHHMLFFKNLESTMCPIILASGVPRQLVALGQLNQIGQRICQTVFMLTTPAVLGLIKLQLICPAWCLGAGIKIRINPDSGSSPRHMSWYRTKGSGRLIAAIMSGNHNNAERKPFTRTPRENRHSQMHLKYVQVKEVWEYIFSYK